MEPVNIPSYIDDPPHFLLWSADEMAPILLGLVIGIFTGNALVLCLLGLVTTKLYRRFRDGRPDGFILHAIYWGEADDPKPIGRTNKLLDWSN